MTNLRSIGSSEFHHLKNDHQNSHHTSCNSSCSPTRLSINMIPMILYLYMVFLIISNSFQLVACRQVSKEHSKYQVYLKCADNIMDIRVKLNTADENKSSGLQSNDSNCKLPLHKESGNETNIKSNQTSAHLEHLASSVNVTLIKSINSTKSIDKTSEVHRKRLIEKNLKFSHQKSDDDDERTYKQSMITYLTNISPTTNLTSNNLSSTHNSFSSTNPTTDKPINEATKPTINKSDVNLSAKKLANNSNIDNSSNRPIVTDAISNETTTTRKKRSTNEANKIKDLSMYLEGWKNIGQCRPEIIKKSNDSPIEESVFRFQLTLQPANDSGLNCGLIRMRNKITDDLDYQHTIIIEYNEKSVDRTKNEQISSRTKKDALLVHCKMPKANFFQANQLIWWSSRMKQQMLAQQRLLEQQERLLEERLKRTNSRSDNEETIAKKQMMTRSDLNISSGLQERLTFDNGQLDKLELNLPNSQPNRQRTRRAVQQFEGSFLDSLPENFTESVDELIDYSGSYTGTTPIPKIHIAVRQNGNQFINSSLDVLPGTPLDLYIRLDDESANVYGLLVSYLKVSDNANSPRQQEEIIILDGCSIDQYIFENFESNDNGKSILAKFRAFRFPGSNYVLFVGTINVCIGQCTPVLCAGGDQQYAYGRRRRRRRDLNNINNNSPNHTITSTTLPPSLAYNHNDFELKVPSNRKGRKLTNSMQPDVNKVFEVEMSTIIRVKKPKEISSLIKNEFTADNLNYSSPLIRSANKIRLKRPDTGVRNIKKRYDSNQSIGKMSHPSYFKQNSLANFSIRLNISIHCFIIAISQFAFLTTFHSCLSI